MRLLHTSDWHLGRRFHGRDLIDAQRTALRHVRATVRAERVDALLVAGDIYDRAIPSLDAVRLFDDTLEWIADLGVPTIMISGNHDSAHRLGVGTSLLARAGVHLRTDPAQLATPVVLTDEHGPVAVYGVPYLDPVATSRQLATDSATHQAVLGAALDRIRADLATRPSGTRSVVVAHAFVTGAAGCDSERDISVGGVAHAGSHVFDGIDYVALGHLHRAQRIDDHIHYSGAPLAYSFSEAGQEKSLTLVDLAAAGPPTVTRAALPADAHLPLARLTGPLDQLLSDPEHERLTDAWLHVTLTDTARPYEPMARLRRRFADTLHLEHVPAGVPAQATGRSYRERLRGRDDTEVTRDFVTVVRGTPPTEGEAALLRRAVDTLQARAHAPDPDADPVPAPAVAPDPGEAGARSAGAV